MHFTCNQTVQGPKYSFSANCKLFKDDEKGSYQAKRSLIKKKSKYFSDSNSHSFRAKKWGKYRTIFVEFFTVCMQKNSSLLVSLHDLLHSSICVCIYVNLLATVSRRREERAVKLNQPRLSLCVSYMQLSD